MSFHTIRMLPVCAAMLIAILAMPAQAQLLNAGRDTRVLSSAPSHVTSLTANLVGAPPTFQGRTWTGVVRNLRIEALPDSQGRMTFGVGSGSRCAYGAGDTDDRVVEFHNADGTWSRGEAIAEACPQWGPAKCSRTVTVDLREHGQGMSTFTVNRGYPPCPSSWGDDSNNIEGGSNNQDRAPALGDAADDVPDSRQDIRARDGTERRSSRRGIFRVRIWGNLCVFGGRACRSFKDGAAKSLATGDLRIINAGYAATFRPAGHCGPRSWPTPAWQAAGAPAHAEWCDVTVDVRN